MAGQHRAPIFKSSPPQRHLFGTAAQGDAACGPRRAAGPLRRPRPPDRLDAVFTACLLLAAALAPADAPTPPPDAAVSDAGELQGEWEVVSARGWQVNLTHNFKGELWVFAGPSAACTTPLQLLARSGPAGRIAVESNPAAEPPTINDGVYRRTGDELLWAQSTEVYGRRPTSLDPAPGVMVWTLRRVRK